MSVILQLMLQQEDSSVDSCVKARGVPLVCASATRVGWTAKSQFEKGKREFGCREERICWEEAEGVAGGNGAGLDVYL
jgi:hypothetical protein